MGEALRRAGDLQKAYRHIVDQVRAKGATNIQWVLHLNNYSEPQEVWNLAAQYYPGPEYCDWLGLSVYGTQFTDQEWADFLPVLDWPYEELRRLDPTKPIMLTEWAVGSFREIGSNAEWIQTAFRAMKDPKYSHLHACVYWHERWQNDDGNYSNLRVNSTPEALEAYRRGVADPFFLDRPIFSRPK